ncbi:MAG: hypothetical protein NTZ24_08620 [Deltaproteobacteria bacterium]|nr:hypothetical protein [Deltaproteobacteria bacterium]
MAFTEYGAGKLTGHPLDRRSSDGGNHALSCRVRPGNLRVGNPPVCMFNIRFVRS